MKDNPDWLVERERLAAFVALTRRRGEMGEAEYVRELRVLDESGDLYAGYVAGLTPRRGGTQPQLV